MTEHALFASGSAKRTATPALAGLGQLLVRVRERGLSPSEEHASIRAIVDWYSAAVAGSTMAPARTLLATLGPLDSGGPSRFVPTGQRLSVRTAALVNGTGSHAAELDDIYREGIYHPGCPTVAAAVALSEHLGVSGARLLRAVAIGYEAGARVAEAINPAHYRYWHTTGTVGTLGAAAAAADLLELGPQETAHALATATTLAAGLQQAFRSDSMSKPLHAGHAAEAGLLAALAASGGFTGALDVLDGPVGFGVAMSDSPDWSAVVSDPDGRLAVERITVKNHSCCGHTFAAVDAALQLRSRGIRLNDVDSIAVRTYTTATNVANYRHPQSEFEARFSTSYCVSAALVLGSVRLRAFDPAALHDPVIRSLEKRVTVIPDEEMERAFPGQRQAEVTISDRCGEVFFERRNTRKGDPDDPLTDEELAAKFADLVEPVLGTVATNKLSVSLWALQTLEQVRDIPLCDHPVLA